MQLKNLTAALAVSGLVTLAGCSDREVRYDDPNKVETVNEDFGRTDIKLIVETMVKDMIENCSTDFGAPPTYITLGKIDDSTIRDEKIDTRIILNKMKTALIRSRRFKIVTEDRNLKKNLEDVEMQQDSGLYADNGKRASTGNWKPPEFRMRGDVAKISKSNSSTKDVYYTITLYCDRINTGETIWSMDKDINKIVDR